MSYDCDILRENIFNLPIQFDQLLFILVIESAFRPSLFFRFDSVLCFVYATKKNQKDSAKHPNNITSKFTCLIYSNALCIFTIYDGNGNAYIVPFIRS